MRKRLVATLVAAILTVIGGVFTSQVKASPADEYTGTHFGTGNLPRGCEQDSVIAYANNACFHMRTGMNGLDSPKVNVLILVPASPAAERDARIIRQAVAMWDGGIHNLAPQMNLDWLGDGMAFNVHVAVLDAATTDFTTYPIADPDIVIVSSNPVGGAGIGIDPVANFGGLVEDLTGLPTREGPCTGLSNPFDFAAWSQVPGFDAHHSGANAGTYSADCPDGGGNVCFTITPAIDPVPGTTDVFGLFDLVAHELGHCLTVGHVGDGAEGDWGVVPTNDIMSYNQDPPGLNKCVSTLNVEGLAVSMSKYLDTNADGAVTAADKLNANDPIGDNTGDAFMTQHPRDHFYASSTGNPVDCPQPELGLLPGATPTNWQPAGVTTTRHVLTVTSPQADATSTDGAFVVTGSVENVHPNQETVPTSSTASFDDADDDASADITEITQFNTTVTDTAVDATVALAALPPAGVTGPSPSMYSIVIDGRRFDSFVRYGVADGGPLLWDPAAAKYVTPAQGTSTWDETAKTVAFHITRAYLNELTITAPYKVSSRSSFGNFSQSVADDFAPNGNDTLGVAAPAAASARLAAVPTVHAAPGSAAQTVTFAHDGGNTFYPENSTLGLPSAAGVGENHLFGLELPQTSDVTFSLDWTDAVGGADLDMEVSYGTTTNTDGGSSAKPEAAAISGVRGHVDISVVPYLVTDETEGSTYTLTANITPLQIADADGDGVPDADDACPNVAAATPNGCPVAPAEHVRVYVDGLVAATDAVDTSAGADTFSLPITVGDGSHTLIVEWEAYGRVVATKTLSVSKPVVTTDPGGGKPPKEDKPPKDKAPKAATSASYPAVLRSLP